MLTADLISDPACPAAADAADESAFTLFCRFPDACFTWAAEALPESSLSTAFPEDPTSANVAHTGVLAPVLVLVEVAAPVVLLLEPLLPPNR